MYGKRAVGSDEEGAATIVRRTTLYTLPSAMITQLSPDRSHAMRFSNSTLENRPQMAQTVPLAWPKRTRVGLSVRCDSRFGRPPGFVRHQRSHQRLMRPPGAWWVVRVCHVSPRGHLLIWEDHLMRSVHNTSVCSLPYFRSSRPLSTGDEMGRELKSLSMITKPQLRRSIPISEEISFQPCV